MTQHYLSTAVISGTGEMNNRGKKHHTEPSEGSKQRVSTLSKNAQLLAEVETWEFVPAWGWRHSTRQKGDLRGGCWNGMLWSRLQLLALGKSYQLPFCQTPRGHIHFHVLVWIKGVLLKWISSSSSLTTFYFTQQRWEHRVGSDSNIAEDRCQECIRWVLSSHGALSSQTQPGVKLKEKLLKSVNIL